MRSAVMGAQVPELEGLTTADCELLSLRVSGDYVKEIAPKVGRSLSAITHQLTPSDNGGLFRKIQGVETTGQLRMWWTGLVISAVEHLDTFLSDIEELDRARRAGKAKTVAEETGKGVILLSDYLKWNPKSPRRRDIQKRISELLRVRGFALFDTTVPSILNGAIPPLIRDLSDIGLDLGDKQSLAFSYMLSALRAGNKALQPADYKRAREFSYRAQTLIDTIESPYYKLTICRQILINSSHLKDARGISDGEMLLDQTLTNCQFVSPMQELRAQEAKGTACGLQGKPEGMQLLADVTARYSGQVSRIELSPIEEVRIIGSTFTVARVLKLGDGGYLEKLAAGGLEVAKMNDLQNYIHTLNDYLKELRD